MELQDLSTEEVENVKSWIAPDKKKNIDLLKQSMIHKVRVEGSNEYCNMITDKIKQIREQRNVNKLPKFNSIKIKTIDTLPFEVLSYICNYLLAKEIESFITINKNIYTMVNFSNATPLKEILITTKSLIKMFQSYGIHNFQQYTLNNLVRIKKVYGLEINVSEFISIFNIINIRDFSKKMWVWKKLNVLIINAYINWEERHSFNPNLTIFIDKFKHHVKALQLKELSIKDVSGPLPSVLSVLYLNQRINKLSLENIVLTQWDVYSEQLKNQLCTGLNKLKNLTNLCIISVDNHLIDKLFQNIGKQLHILEINCYDYGGNQLSIQSDLKFNNIDKLILNSNMTYALMQQLMVSCPNMQELHCGPFNDYHSDPEMFNLILSHALKYKKLNYIAIENIQEFKDATQRYVKLNDDVVWLKEMYLNVKIYIYEHTKQKEVVNHIKNNTQAMSRLAPNGFTLEYEIIFKTDNNVISKASFACELKQEMKEITYIEFYMDQSEAKLCVKVILKC